MNDKFKFIELPRPEVELSPDGCAQILGGKSSSNELDGECNGNPTGCGSGFYCESYCFSYIWS